MDNKNAAGELVLDTKGNPMEIGAHYATKEGDDKIYLGQDPANKDDMVFRSPLGFQTWRRNFENDEYKRRSHAKAVYQPGKIDYAREPYDDAKGGRRKRKTRRRKTKRRKTKGRR